MISSNGDTYQKISDTSFSNHNTYIPPTPSINSAKRKKGGIIFIWPHRRNFNRYREYIFTTWFLTNLFYWMHLFQLLPTDHVLNIPCPPEKYEAPPLKPRERDFIIEPNWDS